MEYEQTGSAKGVLAVWNDVEPLREDEFNEWYQRQHMAERLAVPGFLDARRYVALAGKPKYAAFYSTRDVGILSSSDYLERLQSPTSWTRRVMPWFRQMNRSACVIAASAGVGVGAYAGCIWLANETSLDLGMQLSQLILPAVIADPEIIKVQFWVADANISKMSTAEAELRDGSDTVVAQIVIVEGSTERAVLLGRDRVEREASALGCVFQKPAIMYKLLCYLIGVSRERETRFSDSFLYK